ncbi:error-prone DNA polymerase [Niveispirillum lacus]|uniref:Error-prone DNA polymerase n=1 Tax=Niveispirillum lacus TaxID=1981099 RepID=A0A255Z3C9_9PROT|nr:error-prone DNA polymerase [Niveispirillum lacus]OYQ35987.1 error-prone DNA polymerase [Niveispirillum lacus]
MTDPDFIDLQVTSNFSFLASGSHPHELVLAAAALGRQAIAITDHDSLAGAVRMHVACKQHRLRLVVGCRLTLADAPPVLCYPTDRSAYGRLTRLLTLGKRRGAKGECHLTLADLTDAAAGQVLAALAPEGRATPKRLADLSGMLDRFRTLPAAGLYLAVAPLYQGYDRSRLLRLGQMADDLGIGLLATHDVRYHHPDRQRLHDILTCIRHGRTLANAGRILSPHAEHYPKPAAAMAALFADRPDALANAFTIADRCRFNMDELRYDYPIDPIADGLTPQQELERLTWEGAKRHYIRGIPEKVRQQLEYEFALIGKLDYAPYFLTVHDIVRFARSREILCQGRGSAANSAVCFCLGITAVDPDHHDLLIERFISEDRGEPPDIDVDFEHERREEVIQYIYEKYGRDHAGLVATVICYRSRMAIREVGKVLGLSDDVIGALVRLGWNRQSSSHEATAREAGLDPSDPTLALCMELAYDLRGFPRHLSQHVGGFVISRSRLDELVPIENAAMEDRTVVEWDKDDVEALGLLKIDILALGMLSCMRRGLDMLSQRLGRPLALTDIPDDDPDTYEMICRADTIGVFQIESRAQMTMLPRLRPREFYDLVIEVAIVRPGPIQGDMVHPYLRRRHGLEPVTFPSRELRDVLHRTLGVPLFQEQAMRMAIVAAGFSPGRADQLRRAMATFKKTGGVGAFEQEFIDGMIGKGYTPDYAARCFKQIQGFGSYGFPESHAVSFALLAYKSSWLKCHHPAIFACALLNSQPMGFYQPAQIVRDAVEHRVEVRPVDINRSEWDCTLEEGRGGPALRLGFRQVKGMREDAAITIARKRAGGYDTIRDLWQRTGLGVGILDRLADADVFAALGLDRRQALWEVKRLGAKPLPLFQAADQTRRVGDNRPPVDMGDEPEAILPAMGLGEQVWADYRTKGLSLRTHPLALLRPTLTGLGMGPAASLRDGRPGSMVGTAGLVLVRQRPGTASGVIFVTLEDETGVANLVVWPSVMERFRRPLMTATLLGVRGRLQREGEVIHVVADRLIDLSAHLHALSEEPSTPHDTPYPDARPARVFGEGRNFH